MNTVEPKSKQGKVESQVKAHYAHYAYDGKTPCGLDLSKQWDWPIGHLWTTNWRNVTCAACLGH